jgi:transposase
MKTKTQLSRDAKTRLKWMEHYAKFRSGRLTCRHFGISPDTFYLWKRRYNPADLTSLEDSLRTKKPGSKRKTKWMMEHVLLIERLIEHNPQTNIRGVKAFLAQHNVQVSISTMYRMMRHLRKMSR